MTKANFWWNAINSIVILLFWFFILFTYGEFPYFKSKINSVETRIEAIDYHLQCPVKHDTIVINNYLYQYPVKKNK